MSIANIYHCRVAVFRRKMQQKCGAKRLSGATDAVAYYEILLKFIVDGTNRIVGAKRGLLQCIFCS